MALPLSASRHSVLLIEQDCKGIPYILGHLGFLFECGLCVCIREKQAEYQVCAWEGGRLEGGLLVSLESVSCQHSQRTASTLWGPPISPG